MTVMKKPANGGLFVGVSAPGIQPDWQGLTYDHSSSYGMYSYGVVKAAGQWTIDDFAKLPASSIVHADLINQRNKWDKLFCAGDEVVVVLDCDAHTVRLQSPTVQHVIDIQPQHHKQQWVLNVNFMWGDHQVKLG